MDHQWIRVLLTGLLPDGTIQLVEERYDEFKDVPLTQLGLESMAVMGLVVRFETEFGKEVDFESFNLSDVSTLDRVRSWLGVA